MESKQWAYTLDSGIVIGSVKRIEKDGKKTYYPFFDKDKNKTKDQPKPRVLFGRHTLTKDYVYLVEGEKCAQALHNLNIPCITSQGGASSPHHSNWSLPDNIKTIIALPDNDDVGKKYIEKAIKLIQEHNKRQLNIKIANNYVTGDKEDIIDYFQKYYQDWDGYSILPKDAVSLLKKIALSDFTKEDITKEYILSQLTFERVFNYFSLPYKAVGRGSQIKVNSPFSKDTNPSFSINLEKKIFNDFSTGKGGDIFTFIQLYKSVTFKESLNIAKDILGIPYSSCKSSSKQKSTVSDSAKEDNKRMPAVTSQYYELYKKFLHNLKKDIFTQDLIYFDNSINEYRPVKNRILALKSQFRQEEETRDDIKFDYTFIESHLETLADTYPAVFPVDVPKWDGRDRIKELAERIKLDKIYTEEHGITNGVLIDLLKDWHATAIRKLYTPEVQNRVFILIGGQGLGKDTWVEENLKGAGQYVNPITLTQNEKDVKEQLHTGLYLTIEEFDRTCKTEVAMLKSIITAHTTNTRFSYDRRAERRRVRCSFMATSNEKDILRDHTGNRRFIIFEIEGIDKSVLYSQEDKLQVLAQAFYLCETNYKSSSANEELMDAYIIGKTPESPSAEVIDLFDTLVNKVISTYQSNKWIGYDRNFIPNSESLNIFKELKQLTNYPERTLRRYLNERRATIYGLGRGFYFKMLNDKNEMCFNNDIPF